MMNGHQDLKKIPYGISNYNLLREENGYYVDKTDYIRNIEDKGRFLFFIRPRRFGKSLFLSILEIYYDINRKDRFDYFFEKELKKGFADLVLEPFLAQYPAIKYSYLIEIKYLKTASGQSEVPGEKIRKLREEAETQLKRYSGDEKFQKTIGHTKLVKLVLVFCGHRLVYKGEFVGGFK